MTDVAGDPTERLAAAMAVEARAIVGSLDREQRGAACWPFPADDERRLWFYTPTDHGGLPLSDMTSTQHRLVQRLLAASLSTPGYNTASLILGQENLLDHVEGFTVQYGRERGRDPLLYYLRFFGEPGAPAWGWRFGGHHLSLNFTVADGRVVSTTPCFMGADPASAPLLGPHLHRPLAAVEDLGRELARSLDEGQRSRTLMPAAPTDIIGGNRSTLADGDGLLPLPLVWRGRFEAELDGFLAAVQSDMETELGLTADTLDALSFTVSPKGIPATELTREQREILVALLQTYVGRIPDDIADQQLDKVTSGLDRLHFLWAGSLEPGRPHYYRVQGGDLLVEFDNAARGGNHVHTVWRDLALDFGGDPLAQHYVDGSHPH